MVLFKRILRFLGMRPKTPPARLFVSVNVMRAIRPPGLSRQSTKVIIQVSIWTCVFLVLLFLVIYTILLAYVDKQFHPSLAQAPGAGSYRKVKFRGKFWIDEEEVSRHKVGDFGVQKHHIEKAIWNSSEYYHKKVTLPQCKWQTIFRVLITSAPDHVHQRMKIRNTWCNPKIVMGVPEHAWHCVFVIGKSLNQEVNSDLIREKNLYNDILLGTYVDSYRNLTLKVMHGFNWSTNYCPSSYLVKTDDDCFVNVGLLHNFLLHHNQKTSDLYVGNVAMDQEKLKVIRGKNKKWSVDFSAFPDEYYPPYASGTGYILSTDVAKRLVSKSKFITPISNEDAYVGIVVSQLGITPTSSNRFVISSSGLSVCNFLYVFVVHDVLPDQQQELMKKALAAANSCNHSTITTWS